MAKILLLDGNSMAYRAFFALPTDLATASGQVTNAVYGFTSMLINLFKDHHPDAIAVSFDRPERTFRHDLVDDYKAGRAAAPDILRQQMGLVRQVVETLKIPIVDIAGYEADDVIATLATQARDRGDDVIVVTGDRDAYQLVEDPHVKVLYNRRGVSDYVLYDEAGILERTGVTPPMYPQYAALRGDPSDNLPGVPGVGEKTAAKLLNTYGDLDGVFANVDKCTPKLRESLIAHEPVVRRNATATPLVRDVPLEADVSDLRMGTFDAAAVRDLFNFLEFNTLHPRLMEAIGTAEAVTAAAAAAADVKPLEVDVRRAGTADEAVAVLRAAAGPVAVAAYWDGAEGRSRPDGIAVAPEGSDAGAVWIPASLLAEPAVVFALSEVPFRAHNAKGLMRGLGLDLRGLDVDTAIAAYLIEPAESQYLLDDLATRFLGLEVRSPDAPPPGQLDLSGTTPDPAEEAGRRAVAVGLLVPALAASMDARGLRRLYDEVERPLVRVLARMETAGVRVDVDLLRSIYDGLVAEGARLEEEIQELAGERFLVNSTLQLRRVLFDRLGLQPQKKTKT
ncbi:MAG TPA: 5'-3' exonuclease H3TH domain-containing protein, partial [Acidimicrobiales bacterium]